MSTAIIETAMSRIMLRVMDNGGRLEIRVAAEMTVANLRTHLVIIAGLSHFCVMGIEILPIAKHGICVANVRLAKTAASHSLANLFRCVKSPLTKTPDKLRPKPTHVTSDGKISFNLANHNNTRMTPNELSHARTAI
jgi:hypothetical protein